MNNALSLLTKFYESGGFVPLILIGIAMFMYWLHGRVRRQGLLCVAVLLLLWGALSAPAYALFPPVYDIQTLLEDLRSDCADMRRNARDDLVAIGLPAVLPMMEAWHKTDPKDPIGYRMKMIVVVFNNMLRNHPEFAVEIKKQNLLTAQDIRLLVNTAFDADETIRIQTKEFLSSLKDPRVCIISLSQEKIEHPNVDPREIWDAIKATNNRANCIVVD